jgi:hypothetical protein
MFPGLFLNTNYLAIDVTFHNTKHIFGLPEHTTDFDLPATVATEGEIRSENRSRREILLFFA